MMLAGIVHSVHDLIESVIGIMSTSGTLHHYTAPTGNSTLAVPGTSLYRIPTTYTMLPYKALIAGSASSLPSLVLRSMLKQRRILMRMH